MQIEKLYIQNFRGVEKREITLNPRFTVVIGDNGMGKSSILHALQVSLGAYLQCLPIPGAPVYRRQFKKQDRFVKWNVNELDYEPNQQSTLIKSTSWFSDDYPKIEWTRTMLKNEMTSHNKTEAGELMRAVDSLIAKRKLVASTPLPIVASFGTERTVSQLRKGKSAQGRRTRMEKGYLASLTNRVDFNGVIEWLHNYDNELKYGKEFDGTREAVFSAIVTAIPYLEDVQYNSRYQELQAVVNIDDHFLGQKTHSNMSDGLIAMLNMVAELAFRCVILNGSLGAEAVLQARGIVMIDELDMHLHPNWQRHVVSDLKAAFPNIQFVITTHSPFIVQSLRSEELLIIDDEIKKDGDPLKKSIEAVSANEMGVEDIPRSIEFLEMQEVAEKYFKLIAQGKGSSTDQDVLALKTRLDELEEKFGEDPVFVASLKIKREAKGL